MIEIFMLYLSIPSRINFLQLGRYSLFGERRFRRQFDMGLTSLALIKLYQCLGLAVAPLLLLTRASFLSQVSKLLESGTFGRAVQAGLSGGLKFLGFL